MGVPEVEFVASGHGRAEFVQKLGDSYHRFGFCSVVGHGVTDEIVDSAYADFQRFFALSPEQKKQYFIPGSRGSRGYTPFKVETAKGESRPDLKEFYHVGRTNESAALNSTVWQHFNGETVLPNVWPSEVPGFAKASMALLWALEDLGRNLLSAMGTYLGLESDFFDSRIDHADSILRALHYPPLRGYNQDGCIRAAAHEDINFITLLVGASAEGLELLDRNGTWVPVVASHHAIVVNVGDMLQNLSNGVFCSTTHRVVNPVGSRTDTPRYSVPFFLHANPEVDLTPLPGCVTPDNPVRYPSLTAAQYLAERLKEIKLA